MATRFNNETSQLAPTTGWPASELYKRSKYLQGQSAEYRARAVNDLDEPIHATPVPADGRLYVRTASRLYAFKTED